MIEAEKNGIKFKVEATCNEGFSWWGPSNYPNWEKETFQVFDRFINSDSTYIDLGTFSGPTILYVAQKAKEVYGVELDPKAYKACKKNILANKYKNVKLEHAAISNRDGESPICTKALGSSSCRLTKEGNLRVPTFTIESLMKKWNLDKCDFLKMDIEGAEEICLPAMKNFFKKYKPVLHLSVHKCFGANPKTISNSLLDYYKYIYDSSFNYVGDNLINLINSGPDGFGNDFTFTNEEF